uniref:Serine protease n=1 Tax=uncultured organism TaxID=155900 RepID=D7GN89_9ZZZZ|nr:serine protease [uncultured organism]
MIKRTALILVASASAIALFGLAAVASDQSATPGQYIVVLKDSATDATRNDLVTRHGLNLSQRYDHVLKGFAATVPANELARLKADPNVEFVSEDRPVTVADRAEAAAKGAPTSGQPAQTLPSGVDRINAENKLNKGAGVQVAVVDTGIDLSHPDLAANIVGGKNCSTGKSYDDGNGHGTHVAGTIAALDNAIGVAGIAPQAKLWAVRVLDNNGNGSWSSVICGLDFVTANAVGNGGKISVANMSLAGGGSSDNNCGNTNNDALHKAICRARDKGVTIVVAAGNESGPASASTPAAYDDAVITVSALADTDGKGGGLGAATGYGADDTFASFSNYGPIVDIGAPGVNIRSTWKGSAYNVISGTSMATPHVAGVAALYLATHPGATWTQVRDALKAAGEALGSGHADPSGLHPEAVLRADAF